MLFDYYSTLTQLHEKLLGKVLHGVVVANVLDDFADELDVAGVLSVFDEVAEHFAKDAAEILVACVRKEAAAIGEHAHKLGKQTYLHEGGELTSHAVLLVVEPPRRTELHFAADTALLEAVDESGKNFVVARVEAVQNCFGKFVRLVKLVEKVGKLGSKGLVFDGIEACIGSQKAHVT